MYIYEKRLEKYKFVNYQKLKTFWQLFFILHLRSIKVHGRAKASEVAKCRSQRDFIVV